MKAEWNRETVGQDVFGIKWEVGDKVNVLWELVPNFMWTYGSINDKGEAVTIISCYIKLIVIPPEHSFLFLDADGSIYIIPAFFGNPCYLSWWQKE